MFETCQDHQASPFEHLQTRREFLERFGLGFGTLSLAGLFAQGVFPLPASAESSLATLAARQPHFTPKAKRIIHIFAQGAPSHLDTFDPKPALSKIDEQELPGRPGRTVFASPFKFNKAGKSGIEISEVFPEISKHVDELAIIRSMQTNIPDHNLASWMFNTGSSTLSKPSLGSWVTYGLGTENQNLPGFIALAPGRIDSRNIRASFLPGAYQGTPINTNNTTIEKLIENIRNRSMTLEEQRRQLDVLHKLNEVHSKNQNKDPKLEARLHTFELAYKMQLEATDAFDLSKESQPMRDLYGNTGQGRQMLIARRLLEKGVRFVQVWHGGWDHHNNLEENLARKAAECDKPISALLTDLKQRGMLKDTLVIWGGEFGRTPQADNNGRGENPGRSHNHEAFSIWMAGAGVKGGITYGSTDEFGAKAVENKVHIHDLHATILHLLGFDHEKLTYRYSGRDFRLTDVYGQVVRGVLA